MSYVVKNGDTRADVAAGLNAAFAIVRARAAGHRHGQRASRSQPTGYGSVASFDVDWDGRGYVTHAGQDVAGTIGGITATGRGQQLIVPFSDNQLSGLAVMVTGSKLGDLGNFSYQPGVAQRVQSAVATATDMTAGYITSSENDSEVAHQVHHRSGRADGAASDAVRDDDPRAVGRLGEHDLFAEIAELLSQQPDRWLELQRW